MPYRDGHGDRPKVPWEDTNGFRVCQFTLFPLIRLMLLLTVIPWFLLSIIAWIPTTIVGSMICFLFLGDFRWVKWVDGVGSPPYIFGWIGPWELYVSKPMKKFMGR